MQAYLVRTKKRFTIFFIALISFYINHSSSARAELYLVEQFEEYNLLKNYLVDLKSWETQWSKIKSNDKNNFSQTYYKEILDLNTEISKQTQSLNKKLNLAFKNHNIKKDTITQTSFNEVVRPCSMECGRIDCIDRSCWSEETCNFLSCGNWCGTSDNRDDQAFGDVTCFTLCLYPLVFIPISVVAAGIAQASAYLCTAPFRLKMTCRKTEKKLSNPNIGEELKSLIDTLNFYLEQVQLTCGKELLTTVSHEELNDAINSIERVSGLPKQIKLSGSNFKFTSEAIKAIKAKLAKNQNHYDFMVYRPKRMKNLNIDLDNTNAVDFLFEINIPKDSDTEEFSDSIDE